jgi:hypothetical protein
MKVFVAEIGGRAVAAMGFDSIDQAKAHFSEKATRFTWESDSTRPTGTGFRVREATVNETDSWRAGRKEVIQAKNVLDAGMLVLL